MLEKAVNRIKFTHFSGFESQGFQSHCLPVYLSDLLQTVPSLHPVGGYAYPPAQKRKPQTELKKNKIIPKRKQEGLITWPLSAWTGVYYFRTRHKRGTKLEKGKWYTQIELRQSGKENRQKQEDTLHLQTKRKEGKGRRHKGESKQLRLMVCRTEQGNERY